MDEALDGASYIDDASAEFPEVWLPLVLIDSASPLDSICDKSESYGLAL